MILTEEDRKESLVFWDIQLCYVMYTCMTEMILSS